MPDPIRAISFDGDAARIKLRIEDLANFDEVLDLLRRTDGADVKVVNRKRHTIAAANVSDAVLDELRRLGATFAPERRYDME